MTKEETIKELEKQLPPMQNEPNQDQTDKRQAEILREGKKK